jgi:hypothetical protein
MIQAVYAGVFGFITVAVFIGGWVLVFLLLGLLARVFGGPIVDDGDDGDGE